MFKLPLLQPHLTSTGSDGKPNANLSRYSPFIGTNRNLAEGSWSGRELLGSTAAPGSIQTKGWEAQALDVTNDLVGSDKYKSLALHAEVKLAEALERCARLCPTATANSKTDKPSKLKTAVCCQLLGEFSELCGPFSNVMQTIRNELIRSIYSEEYISEHGTLTFDQLPWFGVVERLEEEKVVMQEERQRFTDMLQEQQEMIATIERKMTSYQQAMESAHLEAAALRSKLEGLVVSEEAASLEAKTGRDELKRLRKEWIRQRDDLEAERFEHRTLKERTTQEISELQLQVSSLCHSLQDVQSKLTEAELQVSIRLPPDSVSRLQNQVHELEGVLLQSRRQIEELETKLSEAQAKLGSMTPRPSWKALRKHGVEEAAGASTQEMVSAVANRLAALAKETANATAMAAELEMVLVEEPAPIEVTLAIATDASSYFITEGSAQPAVLSAEGLGLGPTIPRCLRRRTGVMVEGLQQLSRAETEALVMHIWQSKLTHDAVFPSQHLQGFLYIYFAGQLSRSGKNIEPGCGSPERDSAVNSTANGPGSLHYGITYQAYSLYHALSVHCRSSPVVQLFRQVLSGQLPEHAFHQQQLLFSCLLATARSAAGISKQDTVVSAAEPRNEASSSGEQVGGEDSMQGTSSQESEQHPTGASGQVGTVPTPAMIAAIERLCQGLPSYKTARLQEAYRQSVHPEGVEYSRLEVLLQPLTCMSKTAGQARLVQRHLRAAARAARAEELLYVDTEPDEQSLALEAKLATMRRTPSPTKMHAAADTYCEQVSQPDVTIADILNHEFIAAVLELFLEQQLEGVAMLDKHVSSLAQSESNEDVSQTGDLTPQERDILGVNVPAGRFFEQLTATGIPDANAYQMASLILNTTSGICPSTMQASAGLLDALQINSQRVWSGLALIKLKAQLFEAGSLDYKAVLANTSYIAVPA